MATLPIKRAARGLMLAAAILAGASAAATERGVLFKISAAGNTMHVFGTMHVQNPDDYPVDPVLLKAIEGASGMYVESADSPSTLGALWSVLSLRKDPVYASLSDDMQVRLKAALKRVNLPEGLAYRTHPILLGVMFGLKGCSQAAKPGLTVDAHLIEFARKSKVPVESLDEARAGQDLLDNASPEVRRNIIESGIEGLESGSSCAELEALRQAWLSTDEAAFEALNKKMESDTTPYGRYLYEVMLRRRDVVMADKLLAVLPRQDRVVVAVGAAHLFGKGSVIDRLKAGGATVEQLY